MAGRLNGWRVYRGHDAQGKSRRFQTRSPWVRRPRRARRVSLRVRPTTLTFICALGALWTLIVWGPLPPWAMFAEPANALAEDLTGRASVIDGDTIEIHGQRIRLHGIDAPESGQTCDDTGGKAYRCGQRAALALADKIGAGTVSCEQRDVDRYGRIVAVCRLGDLNLNGWLVSEGLAIDCPQYSGGAYASAQAEARAAGLGLWAGAFVPPWEWREAQRTEVSASELSDCRIKGNISSKGERIYHVPSGEYYDRTRINESAGERWFCTEEDAVTAGWRRSKR